MKILRAKHRTVRGGWNYLPEVQELPPDTDDLGSVLQVLVRAGGHELASTCDEPIRLALDAQETNGGIPTWVLDPRAKSESEMHMSDYLKVVNGWGSHIDVVANLALGLILYDSARYHRPLYRVASYLENQQDGRGAWQSRWYEDSYYGTYRATAALGRLKPRSLVLDRAQEFLLKSQHSSGGWGNENQCPLSTAFAILALTTFSKERLQRAIDGGIRYLITTQDKDGGWPASPFISFETSDGSITYESRTLTTAFCVKAFLASSSVLR
jgi:Squalene-hopene cyclase C-terminal domain